MSVEIPPPYSGDVQKWAEQLADYLVRQGYILPYVDSASSATQDGIWAWDASLSRPVYSSGGVYYPVVTLEDLPTSDPGVTGMLWNNAGTLAVSA